MADETDAPLRATTIRFSETELELLAEVQNIIAQLANNRNVRVTQRSAIVSALELFRHEKTRRKAP